MENDTLVMESTTDTPEQIRQGLGLDPLPETPDDGAPAAETPAVEEPETPVVEEPPAPEPPKAAAPAPKPPIKQGAKPKPNQKELDRVAAASRRDANAKNAILEAEVKALRERLDQTLAPVAVEPGKPFPKDPAVVDEYTKRREALGPKPKQEDFADFTEFEDKKDEWLMAQGALRAQEQTAHEGAARRSSLATTDASRAWQSTLDNFNTRVAAVKTKYADYEEVAKAADASKLSLTNAVTRAVLESEDECAELQYYLMKNPDEAKRLNALPPVRVGLEVGKLAARLSTGAGRPVPPKKPISRAAVPTGTELGGGNSVVADDLEGAQSQAEYNRMRLKQRQAKGLGR